MRSNGTRFAPAGIALAVALTAAGEPLRFSVPEGRVLNEFFRDGPVAAHLVLTPGPAPRLVVAFPAGNSGVALWLEASAGALSWDPEVALAAAGAEVAGGMLHGITADLVARGTPVSVRHAIIGSVRVIRDYEYNGTTPPEVHAEPARAENAILWQRPRLDGGPGYRLSVEVVEGDISADDSGAITLNPGTAGALRLRLTALTGEEPLTPLPADALLTAGARADERLRQILAFLSYEEKLLAGSWRFNTYFGRDTLMSLALLMPVLEPGVVEAGLSAVIERLNPSGEVAHEEDIGEFAALRRLRRGETATVAPLYDYKMVDDDYMLPVVAARYLLDTPAGRERAGAFLARRTAAGTTYGAALAQNFRHVVTMARAFADAPDWRNLVALKPGEYAGNWRDSREGLGGGRIPYDVNGVFVPAALAAIDRFRAGGALGTHLAPETAAVLAPAGAMARTWRREAPGWFDVEVDPASAAETVARYARAIGVDPGPALASLDPSPVAFRAVALDEHGGPIPIMHSDQGFALLLLDLAAAEVGHIASTLLRPFPAGLATDVGALVANPAYAPAALYPLFDRGRYHGTVVWSWHHAVLAAGLDRQIARGDLDETSRAALAAARDRLDDIIAAAHEVRGSELWSWSHADGRYRAEAFGQRQGDESESNAAQLWSTVHLALPLKRNVDTVAKGEGAVR